MIMLGGSASVLETLRRLVAEGKQQEAKSWVRKSLWAIRPFRKHTNTRPVS